jgi:hypothetical protein
MQRSESAPYGSFTIDVEIYKPDLGKNKRSVFSVSPKRAISRFFGSLRHITLCMLVPVGALNLLHTPLQTLFEHRHSIFSHRLRLADSAHSLMVLSIMDTMSSLLLFLHVPQACLSAYTIYLSSIVIPKLQRYEEKSEKAAEYSNFAEQQLHTTRTTQTSGALTVSRLAALIISWHLPVLAYVLWNLFRT